jgi:hypothetical protein
MSDSGVRKKVAVKDLHFGMYVFQLDRPWTETPFMFQGLHAAHRAAARRAAKYCEFVHVDQERSDTVLKPQLGAAAARAAPGRGPAAVTGNSPGSRTSSVVEVEKEARTRARGARPGRRKDQRRIQHGQGGRRARRRHREDRGHADVGEHHAQSPTR